MKILIFLFLFIILFIFYLSEKNRKNAPKINFNIYYQSPIIILMGIFNEFVRLFDDSYIYDVNEFKIHNKLKLNHDKLLKEFELNYDKYKLINPGVFDDDFKQNNDKYGYFNVNYYGYINNGKFNELEKIIKDNDDVVTCFYSVIDGKKNIPKHRGPYNGIIRYHYTLFSPDDKRDYLKVNGKKLYWMEKDGFMFDDTYEHYVKKKSKGMRVSIIIDVKRKLPYILNILNDLILKHISNTEYVINNRKKLELKLRKKIKIS